MNEGFFKMSNTLYNWKADLYGSIPEPKYVVYSYTVKSGIEMSIFETPFHSQLKLDIIRLQRNERS